MLKNKRFLTLFLTLAIFVSMGTIFATSASAKIDKIVTVKDGVYYEYNYNDLVIAAENAFVGIDDPMYKHYYGKAIYAIHDDVKGYIDYNKIKVAAEDAFVFGNAFNINDFISNTTNEDKITVSDTMAVDKDGNEIPTSVTIKSVSPFAKKKILIGKTLDEVKSLLPTKGILTLSNGNKVNDVQITSWDSKDFESGKLGTFNFTGTYNLPDGVTGEIIPFTQQVEIYEVTVTSIDAIADIEVPFGTTTEAAITKLPTNINLKLSNNTSKQVAVTWTSDNYIPSQLGVYTFVASYSLPTGVTGNKPEVKVNVTVVTDASTVNALIEALPSVEDLTIYDADQVGIARDAYEKLPEAEKAFVTQENKDKLSALVAQIKVLEDKEVVEIVEEMIATAQETGSFEDIAAAQEAYNELTAEQKAKVDPAKVDYLNNAVAALKVATVITDVDTASPVENGTQVTLTTTTTGAAIYYTIDGSEPTIEGTLYEAPIVLTTGTAIKAIAVKDGMFNSDVATFTYEVKEKVAAVTANPASGEVAVGTEVVLTTTTTGAAIYYTTNGELTLENAQLYTGPITITTGTAITAIAVKDGMTASEVMTFTYTIIEKVALNAPVITLTDKLISWEAIANVANYEITITPIAGEKMISHVAGTSYDLSKMLLGPGEYKITVTAKAPVDSKEYKDSELSNEVTYIVE